MRIGRENALTPGLCKGDCRIAVAPPVDFGERRGPGDVLIGAFLQDRNRALRHPSARGRRGERAFAKSFAIGRVAENKVEGLKVARFAELGRVAPPDLGRAGETQRLDIAADGGARRGALLDEECEAGAARQGLEPERA